MLLGLLWVFSLLSLWLFLLFLLFLWRRPQDTGAWTRIVAPLLGTSVLLGAAGCVVGLALRAHLSGFPPGLLAGAASRRRGRSRSRLLAGAVLAALLALWKEDEQE
jgi:hypothetical protein